MDDNNLKELKLKKNSIIENFKLTPEQKKEIALSEQFLGFKNNYHETIIKTAIRDAAMSGSEIVRFPTPYTVANVEGYVDTGYNEDGDAISDYEEEDIWLGRNITNHLGYEAIVSDVYDGGYNALYSPDGEHLNVNSEDEVIQGEVDHLIGDFEYHFKGGEDYENIIEKLNDKIEDTKFSTALEDLEDYQEIVDLAEEFGYGSEFEEVKQEIIDEFERDFDVDEFYSGMFNIDQGYSYYYERGQKFYVDAGGADIYEESESYRTEVSKEDFTLDSIQDEGQRKIAAKYGVDENGNKGLFYKYLDKVRPDLQEIEDDNGFTWWESAITPADKGAVEMFQLADSEISTGKFSELDNKQLELDWLMETKIGHPAREMMKYVNKRTGELPHIDGRGGYFSKWGDEIYEGAGYENYDAANDGVAEYSKLVQKEKELRSDIKVLREEKREALTPAYVKENYHIKLKKKKIEELEASVIVDPTDPKIDELKEMKKKLNRHKFFLTEKHRAIETGLDVGFKQGLEQTSVYYKRMRDIKNITRSIDLPDRLVKKITDPVNIQLMSDKTFTEWIENFKVKADLVKQEDLSRIEYKSLLQSHRLNNVDALRLSMGFPSIKNMSKEQLDMLNDEMRKFNDATFLSKRKLETINNTPFHGIKTQGEMIERTEELLGTPFSSLSKITANTLDRATPDTILREKNEFTKFMVDYTNKEMLKKEARMITIRDNVNVLEKEIRKSKKGGIANFITPTNSKIFEYIEAKDKDSYAASANMSKAEIDYANYIIAYFARAYQYLKDHSDIKMRDLYFPHMRKTFTETLVHEKSLPKAIKATFNAFKEDRAASQILDEKTGEIIAFEKFFKYAMQRTGQIDPSQNISRVFLSYAETFETKKAVDSVTPLVLSVADLITDSKGKTKTGLAKDPSVKNFTVAFLNNKKGRRFDYGGMIPQGGATDIALKSMMRLFSFMMIAGSIPIQVASIMGELTLGVTPALRGALPKGMLRVLQKGYSKGGHALMDETLVGRGLWDQVNDAGMSLPDKLMSGLYGGFILGRNFANKLHAAGLMTKEEFDSGTISQERKQEIINEMERFRDTGVVHGKSIYGATSAIGSSLQFKTWAAKATLRTLKTSRDILVGLSKGEIKELTSKQALELYTSISMAFLIAAAVSGDDKCTGSRFECELQKKVKREAQSFSQAMSIFADPRTLAPSPKWLLGGLFDTVSMTGEVYKRNGYDFKKGDSKSITKIQRLLTPKFVRQFRE